MRQTVDLGSGDGRIVTAASSAPIRPGFEHDRRLSQQTMREINGSDCRTTRRRCWVTRRIWM
jgi:hypothetical protein